MNVIDWLIRRARKFLEKGQQIPLDLVMEMASEGIDVPAIERQYYRAA